MSITIRIPTSLHRAIPSLQQMDSREASVSSTIRALLASAVANHATLIAAIANRRYFSTPQDEIARHMIYIPAKEQEEASYLAAKYLYSLNQLIQILLEGAMYDVGKWPQTEKD